MQSQIVVPYANIFIEKVWYHKISDQYTNPTKFVQLNRQDLQFLVNDQTNWKSQNFSKFKQISQLLEQFQEVVFIKVCNRTAKDLSLLMNHIKNINELITVIKMSEYLTQGLAEQLQSENLQNCFLNIRKFSKTLEKQQNQFRIYVKNQILVGICQKIPNKIIQIPTELQLQKSAKLISHINDIIRKQNQNFKQEQKEVQISFVVDAYISQKGKVRVLSIQPFHIHSLSLFQQNQLNNHYKKMQENKINKKENKEKPLIKCVRNEKQLKQIDLSHYKMGSQLIDKESLQQWKRFINQA